MGLTMYVGDLADTLEEVKDLRAEKLDEEADELLADVRGELAKIRAALEAAGLPPHEEPEAFGEGQAYWNAVMRYGPVEDAMDLAEDLAARGVLDLAEGDLDHLTRHSSTGGYYLPLDFPTPLTSEDGTDVGSAPRLKTAIEAVWSALKIPIDLNEIEIDHSGDGEGLGKALSFMDRDKEKWGKLTGALYGLLALHQGARVSLANGMALCLG